LLEPSQALIGGEACLTTVFRILLIAQITILEIIETMMQASLSRLMVATPQVKGNYNMKANNKEG
jgi:hypothetical protein